MSFTSSTRLNGQQVNQSGGGQQRRWGNGATSYRESSLLGDLHVDKIYLERLLENPGIKRSPWWVTAIPKSHWNRGHNKRMSSARTLSLPFILLFIYTNIPTRAQMYTIPYLRVQWQGYTIRACPVRKSSTTPERRWNTWKPGRISGNSSNHLTSSTQRKGSDSTEW